MCYVIATVSDSVGFATRNNVVYSKWQDKYVQDRTTAPTNLSSGNAFLLTFHLQSLLYTMLILLFPLELFRTLTHNYLII